MTIVSMVKLKHSFFQELLSIFYKRKCHLFIHLECALISFVSVRRYEV